jgi:SAM-dependent MidA family methyltransferase
VWEALGRPAPFTVFEPGAGEGALARAILDWAEARDDGFREALRYVAIEPNARGTDSRVTWAAPPIAPAEAGVVVANEFFDALPVRLFEASERGPVEIMVRWDGERFVEARGSVADMEDAPAEGRFEVNQHTYPAMRQLCRLFGRGGILVFDYGYPREELWAPWRTSGTLLCYYRHTAHEDPLIHVGQQDLTAHVDLSELAAAAEDEGCVVHGPVPQSEFLHALGLGAVVDSARGDMGEYFVRRRALEKLTDGAALGRIRVMGATRGLATPPPGFEAAP